MRHLIAIIALGLASASYGESEYYVWVDENGVTNYAERNPQGYDAELVGRGHRFGERVLPKDPEPTLGSRPGAVPTPEAAPPPQGAPAASQDPDALIGDERAAIAAKIAETKRQNCSIGKRNLAQLEAFSRIRVKGTDGQERVLSEAERQGRIDEARGLINENCTG